MLKTIKNLWRIWRRKPYVEISRYGIATPSPKVNVSVHGGLGAQGVYCYADDAQGNALADLYGKGLARITGLPLRDMR